MMPALGVAKASVMSGENGEMAKREAS